MGAVLLPDNLAKETPATNINRQRLIQAITASAYTKKSHKHRQERHMFEMESLYVIQESFFPTFLFGRSSSTKVAVCDSKHLMQSRCFYSFSACHLQTEGSSLWIRACDLFLSVFVTRSPFAPKVKDRRVK
ncbi:hypothetical protein GOODEAATRI_014003 [Goodea atripinnis]|uniref:Uncharacterized protein n=1 Tax=Goodea atripinnis TaxID=208336 RepID=A0ABV0PXX1_9TELE